MTDDKRTRWSASALAEFDNTDQLFALSELMANALMVGIATMIWRTRQIDGSQDYFDDLFGELNDRLMTPIEFCAEMVNCINNDEAVRNALQQWFLDSGLSSNTIDPDSTTINDRMTTEQQGAGIKGAPGDCDKDTLWAGCKEVVLRLDDNARTVLEDAIVIADIAQRYVDLIGAIPVIGDVATSILNQFTKTIPDIYDSFNAYSSTEHIEELTCSLFELVCNDCRYPTFEEVATTVASNALGIFSDWQTVTMTAVVAEFLETGAFTPSLVWHSMLMFELCVLYLGARWNGNTGTQAITFWAELGEDEPSSDWELLCDGCDNEYPDIEIGNDCQAPPYGSIVSFTAPNTWRIQSQTESGGSQWGRFQDSEGRDIKIVSATYVSGLTIVNHSRWNSACVPFSASGIPINTPFNQILFAAGPGTAWVYDFVVELA